ncbi:MAG: M3 family metallopeptidase [bacterium]|nr:M3 family metallopeptidase [bacterium]
MKVKTYTKKDFEWTKWNAATIRSLVPKIIAHKKKVYAEIKKIPAKERTFENTVYALEMSGEPFGTALSAIEVLSKGSPAERVRKAANEVKETLGKKLVDIEYDKGIYRALREYGKSPLRKKEKLLPEEKKLFKDMLLSYKRMGFDLPEAKQKTLKRIMKRLSVLSTKFEETLNEWDDFIVVKREELLGLPERYVEGLERTKDGRYKVTLKYPDLIPFMEHAKDERRRKELSIKNSQKGGIKNLKRLEEAARLRHKKAVLLGYRGYFDFVLERRMAKNTRTAERFIEGLHKKIKGGLMEELRELAGLKEEMTRDGAGKLSFYNVGYYSERLKERRFNINSEKLREYFPFEKVVEGTFAIYQKLFSVAFRELKGYPVWHEDVRLFEVRDKGKTVSYFMLDLYPRKGKYGHACAQEVTTGRMSGFRGDAYVAPLAVMFANFPKPTKGTPSLLSHGEVETFFHEFGHIMHAVLTKGRYPSQSGYNTVWDFVEAPSQMLENWTWDAGMLALLSEHYRTKAPLPEADLKNLLAAKYFMVFYNTMRQLSFGTFDLAIHRQKPKRSIAALFREISREFMVIPPYEKSIFPAGFGHMMGGYAAGYYGYLWSKVYASDMFTRFKKEGLLNPRTGRDYRTWILEKGSSMEEIDLVKKFLGREPNNKAFLKEIGAIK